VFHVPADSHFPARRPRLAALAVILFLLAGSAQAADKALPVPRFVTLRSDQVNLRTGPGERYPIDWVLTRKDMPVEITAEFENWRRIRAMDGTEGWVHERMVTGRRAVIVRGQIRALHEKPRADSDVVAKAEPGVIARLLECEPQWCRIEADKVTGWLKRDELWGVYANETVQ
jgi:SH3-like domain-containing protein